MKPRCAYSFYPDHFPDVTDSTKLKYIKTHQSYYLLQEKKENNTPKPSRCSLNQAATTPTLEMIPTRWREETKLPG